MHKYNVYYYYLSVSQDELYDNEVWGGEASHGVVARGAWDVHHPRHQQLGHPRDLLPHPLPSYSLAHQLFNW